MGEAFLIGVHFPVNFLLHAAFHHLAVTYPIEDDFGVFDRFVELVGDDDFDESRRDVFGRPRHPGEEEDAEKEETGLHVKIIAHGVGAR